jgi:hypothetical protein
VVARSSYPPATLLSAGTDPGGKEQVDLLVVHQVPGLRCRQPIRHHGFGPHLAEGLEDEPSLRRPGMGDLQLGGVDCSVIGGNDVQIESSWSPVDRSLPTSSLLDGLKSPQHLVRAEVRRHDHDRVQIGALLRPADRGGLVEPGDRRHVAQPAYLLDRDTQVLCPVSLVGAEGDRVCGHRARSIVTATSS